MSLIDIDEPPLSPVGPSLGVLGWLSKATWAIADQGLFAGSNFLLSIALARWLGTADYGTFTVAFSVFLLAGAFYNSLLVTPMLVVGPARYTAKVGDYLGVLLCAHALASLVIGLLMTMGAWACWICGQHLLALSLLSLAIAQAGILLLWLCRRACYIESQPSRAAIGGMGYLVFMAMSLAFLKCTHLLSVPAAMLVLGLVSLPIALWLVCRLGAAHPDRLHRQFIRQVAADQWSYGRWSLPTALAVYVQWNLFSIILAGLAGMEASGIMQAMNNLIMPMLNVILAVGMLLQPRMAQARGQARFGRLMWLGGLVLVVPPIFYWLLLGCAHAPLCRLVYGERFQHYTGLLWVIGLVPILEGLTMVPALALQACERVALVCRATMIASLVLLAAAVPLIHIYHLAGAAWAPVLWELIQMSLLWWSWRRVRRAASPVATPQQMTPGVPVGAVCAATQPVL